MSRWTLETEPVRIWAIVAAVLAAAGGMCVAIGNDINIWVAAGTALGQLGLVVGGGELARSKAYSPEYANEVMDADSVISAAERGEHEQDEDGQE